MDPCLTPGARVRLVDDEADLGEIVLGTIKSVSDVGYTQVDWDEPSLHDDWFSPVSAPLKLRIVTGQDAAPRHRWDNFVDEIIDGTTKCERCGTVATVANYFEACAK